MKSKWFPIVLGIVILFVIVTQIINCNRNKKSESQIPLPAQTSDPALNDWKAPDLQTDSSLTEAERKKLEYGRNLIAHTAIYFGPKGSIAHITNGMNCQNCHLKEGTQPWANNFATTFTNYPKISGRSGKEQTLYDRINSCFQRSMNGKPLDTASKEMQAMFAYIKFIGKNAVKGEKPQGAGLPKLSFINRAADPKKGEGVFITFCKSCHGDNGQGKLNVAGTEYIYPPLWGNDSYNDGAGLYRLSNFASFVKSNMPYQVTSHWSPSLTQEHAWDVAAFVNSQPRPHKNASNDYPDLKKKPFDDPFGPYADSFPQSQHKYGPFEAIVVSNPPKQNH